MEDVVELMENVIEGGLRAAFIVDGFGDLKDRNSTVANGFLDQPSPEAVVLFCRIALRSFISESRRQLRDWVGETN